MMIATTSIVRRIQARGRRMAAIHEAGHVIVAREHGAEAYAYIVRRVDGDPRTDKVWAGQCRFRCSATGRHGQRLISLAGFAAEMVWRGLDAEGFDIMMSDPVAMSATDWQRAGVSDLTALSDVDDLARAYDDVLQILHDNWPDVLVQARALIEDAKANDGGRD
jgi:hypothetical protein